MMGEMMVNNNDAKLDRMDDKMMDEQWMNELCPRPPRYYYMLPCPL